MQFTINLQFSPLSLPQTVFFCNPV